MTIRHRRRPLLRRGPWRTYDTKAPSRRPAEPHLDNLTLSRKEGWRACTEAPKRIAPELLTKSQIRRLSEAAADIYKQRREDWHNNLGPLKTPLAALHEDLGHPRQQRPGR